jgi:hypothetical protein
MHRDIIFFTLYNLDLVGVQVIWNKGVIEPVDDYTSSVEMEMEMIIIA